MENVSNTIQLGLLMSVGGMLVGFLIMVIPTFSDCDPAQALDVDVGNFSA